MSDTPRTQHKAYFILALSAVFMSSNLIFGRAGIASIEPWTLAFWRWCLAVLFYLPIGLPALLQDWPKVKEQLGYIVLLGFLAMVICGGLVYVSLTATTATNATLIYTTSPVMIVLLEWIFKGQRPRVRSVLGIVLAFSGIAIIVSQGSFAQFKALSFSLGDVGIAIAALSWAAYSIGLKAERLNGLTNRAIFFAIAIAGTLWLFPAMLYFAIMHNALPTAPDSWLSLVAMALVPSILAFMAFQYGVRAVGPTLAGVFMYLMPISGLLMATFLLGEAFETYHLAGLVFVLGGVMIATLPKELFRAIKGGKPQ